MKKSPVSAVIFDFNGTLFFDTEFHNKAWMEFAASHGKILLPEEMDQHVHGSTNKEILGYFFQRALSEEEIEKFSATKEEMYRTICRQNPDQCILAPGAKFFLNLLQRKNIPKTIATASVLENVNFFIELFSLNRWFEKDKIVFDSGEFRGKPFPDMFLAAANKLSIPIGECLIIEDSFGGIEAAKRAGAAHIVAISTHDSSDKFSQLDYLDQIITDFRQLELLFA